MLSDLRRVLSSPFLKFIIGLSVLLRILFQIFYLPNTASSFGPDEGTYAVLATYVSEGRPAQDFPVFGPGLYNTARTLIIPSSLLIKFGVNELVAVRAIATLYGFLSLIFLLLCYFAVSNLFISKNRTFDLNLDFFQRCILLFFTFMPSNFLWSNLGLRESGSQLFLLSFSYFALKILKSHGIAIATYFLLGVLSLTLAFGARRETALVFTVVSLIFSVALAWRTRNFLILGLLLIGFIAGQIFTTTPLVEAREEFSAIEIAPGESKSPVPTQSGESKSPVPNPTITSKLITQKCDKDGQEIKIDNNNYICVVTKDFVVKERNPFESISSQLLTTRILEYKRNINRIDAQSALPQSSCNYNLPKSVVLIVCNVNELPYRLPTFLFRPFPIIDSGSNFLRFAGMENVIWLALILISLYMALRRKVSNLNRYILAWLFSYIIIFSVAASLYEGNLGTAFRHKSSILWPLSLGLLLSLKDSRMLLRKMDANQI